MESWTTNNNHAALKWHTAVSTDTFDLTMYLLGRYGSRMTKKELCFERKNSRATTDNERNPRHPSYNPVLAAAEVRSGVPKSGKAVLFDTSKVAKLLEAELRGSIND